MEALPQEIFLRILDYVAGYPKEFLPYVTVSRRWQRTIEPWYFKAFRIKNSDLPAFASLFRTSQGHRKALVKEIYLDVVLDEYDGEECQQHSQTNNQVFSAAVFELFQLLELFNEDCNVQDRGGLHLNLRDVSSPSDSRLPRTCQQKLWGTFVRLLDHESLPTLSCVSRFQCASPFRSRKFDPMSMMYMAGKLEGLKICRIDYCNDRNCFDTEAQWEIRHGMYCTYDLQVAGTYLTLSSDFAKALSAFPHSLDELLITFRATSPLDEATSPRLIPLSTPVDPLNLAMHKLIQRAKVTYVSLSAQHVISPEFFWPCDGLNVPLHAAPFWPRLTTVRILASPISPDGHWYFLPDPKVGAHDESAGEGNERGSSINIIRSVPNPEKMNPLLIAMAKAVRYAPALQEMSLRFGSQKLIKNGTDVGLKREFNVTYLAGGVTTAQLSESENPRLIWQVQDWRPDDAVDSHWREALGPDAVMVYE